MKSRSILRGILTLGLSASSAWGLPQDPQVVHGQAQISNQAQAVMQILQSSPQAIINWSQFNISPGETVRFLQPNQLSSVLNRVTGVDPSVIQGLLQGNGRVFLLNPNGILFGPGSVVDVGSFMASTLQMSDADFLSGQHNLTQSNSLPMAALVNQGTIKVAEGGFVVLVSPLLDNAGVILAQSGQVQLGATREATFSVDGQGLVQFVVPDGFDPQFTGGGQGGTVLIQPGQMSQMLSQVIQNPGVVEAGQLQAQDNAWLAHGSEGILLNSGTISVDGKPGQQAGSIRLDSSGATILTPASRLSANGNQANAGQVLALSAGPTVGLGTIEAASQGGGDGGFVEVSGRLLSLHGAINVTSQQGQNGQVLLDPGNLTIIDAGPGSLDGSLPNILESTGGPNNHSVSTSAIAAISGAVTLEATNDITYTTATGFSAPDTDLTVSAGNNIVFTGTGNLPITTRSLNLDAGQDLVVQSGGVTNLTANTGSLSLTGGRNVTVSAPTHLVLSSPVSTSIQGGTNVFVSSGVGGNSMTLTGPNTTMTAGQDLTLRSNFINPTTSNVTLSAVRDLRFVTHPGTSMTANVGSLNATAGRDLEVTGGSSFGLTASQGDLLLSGGRNATVTAESNALSLVSSQGATRIQAQDVQVSSSGSMTLSGNTTAQVNATQGNASLHSGSNLNLQSASGPVVVNASSGDATVNASNQLVLSSPVSTLVSGGNNVFVSSGVGGNLADLSGPNITMTAGQDLTFRSNVINQTTTGNFTMSAARDLRFVTHPGTSMTANVGSLNATAGRDLEVTGGSSFGLTASQGDLLLSGGRNATVTAESNALSLVSSQGAVRIQAQDVQVSSSGSMTLSGNTTAQVNATQGSASLNSGNALNLQSASGPVVVNATSGDATVNASNQLVLSSPVSTLVSGSNNVFVSSGVGGNPADLSGPNTTMTAGQDLTFRSNVINQTTTGNVTLSAARDLRFVTHPGTSMTANVGSLNATAGRDLEVTGGSSFGLTASQGDLLLSGGRNATVTAQSNALSLVSSQGATRIQAQDVQLSSSGSMTLSGNTTAQVNATQGNASLHSGGSLNLQSASGPVVVNASAGDATVNASGPLVLSSPVSTLVNGGNNVFVSSGVGGNPADLSGPNTTMTAGQDLTFRSNVINQTTTGNVTMSAARDLRLVTHPGTSMTANVGSLNATAGRDLEVTGGSSFGLTASQGDLLLSGGRNATVAAQSNALSLVSSQGATRIQAQDVQLSSAGSMTLSGNTTAQVNATQGNASLHSGGSLNLQSASGPVVVNASAGDATVNASGPLVLSSPVSNLVNGGNDVFVSSGVGGNPANLSGPNTTISAGQDLTFRSNVINQGVSGNVSLGSGRDLSLNSHAASSMSVTVGSLNVTAGQDLTTNVASNLGLTAPSGASFAAARDLRMQNGSTTLNSVAGNIALQAGNSLDLSDTGPFQINALGAVLGANNTAEFRSGSTINTGAGGLVVQSAGSLNTTLLALNSSTGNVSAQAGANLTVGNISAPNVNLNANNITLQSFQNLGGANYTINATQDLREITPAVTGPNLTSLNITAGSIFGNGNNSSFSVPDASQELVVTVTGGNDTTFQAAASMSQINGANISLLTTPQTGDIYVDGILVFQGSPPPPPPPDPPPPVPIPEPPLVVPPPPDVGLTDIELAELRAAVAQSNIMMGNLGSFSRVLEPQEKERLTVRQDSLRHTSLIDPFSPTLALVVATNVEMSSFMATFNEELRDKDSPAFNAMVDQEVREIWEVRYWRHLLEGFVIWEDPE